MVEHVITSVKSVNKNSHEKVSRVPDRVLFALSMIIQIITFETTGIIPLHKVWQGPVPTRTSKSCVHITKTFPIHDAILLPLTTPWQKY